MPVSNSRPLLLFHRPVDVKALALDVVLLRDFANSLRKLIHVLRLPRYLKCDLIAPKEGALSLNNRGILGDGEKRVKLVVKTAASSEEIPARSPAY
jgi:hypothetical protein